MILSEAYGELFPTRLAWEIKDTHDFKGVWLIGLDAAAVAEGKYAYTVTELNIEDGQAPMFRVALAEDFGSWTVEQVQ